MKENSAKPPALATPPQAQQAAVAGKPNYDPFASIISSHPSSRTPTPAPSLVQQRQAARQPQSSQDPFAAISATPPRESSPFTPPQQSQPISSPSASLFDLTSLSHQPTHAPSNLHQQNNGGSADDDWNFSSALPEERLNLPGSRDLQVSNTSVGIQFKVSRPSVSDSVVSVLAHFSNNTSSPITEYAFQVAVTKVRYFVYMISYAEFETDAAN